MRLLWLIDITLGHKLVMPFAPELLQQWWYVHVCSPAGLWECRDTNWRMSRLAYDNHDANIIKSTLEAVIIRRDLPGFGVSDDEARNALAALDKLVALYLPEGEVGREIAQRQRNPRGSN